MAVDLTVCVGTLEISTYVEHRTDDIIRITSLVSLGNVREQIKKLIGTTIAERYFLMFLKSCLADISPNE